MDQPLYKLTQPLPVEPLTALAKIAEETDSRTLVIRFRTAEEREQWRQLAQRLGHDEHALALRMMTRFITHCKGDK